MNKDSVPPYAKIFGLETNTHALTNEIKISGCRIVDVQNGRAVLGTVLSDHGSRTAHFQLPPGALVTISSPRICVPEKEKDIFFDRSPIPEEEVTGQQADYTYSEVEEIDEVIKGLCPASGNLSSNNKEYLSQMVQCYLNADNHRLAEIARLTNSDVAEYLKGAKDMAREMTNGSINELFQMLRERARKAAAKFSCDF